MSLKTNIEWADSTASPWFGCTECSAGCAHCYARKLTQGRLARFLRTAYQRAGLPNWDTRPLWGDTAPRVLSAGFERTVLALNARPWVCDLCGKPGTAKDYQLGQCSACHQNGITSRFHRRRIFPSLMDWLDPMPAGCLTQEGEFLSRDAALARFLDVISRCDQLSWILCTKRPELFAFRMEEVLAFQEYEDQDNTSEFGFWLNAWAHGNAPANVTVLASVENQPQADARRPHLLRIPAAWRGFSVEPLLGRVVFPTLDGIDWLPIGGESGKGARPCNVDWIRSLVKQGAAAKVPVFVKQFGSEYVRRTNLEALKTGDALMQHSKGGDPEEWPKDLRVRQFPVGW